MHTPTLDELKFEPLELSGNPPPLTCCCCGKPVPATGGFVCEIPVTEDGNWSLVLCSLSCLQQFYRLTRGVVNGYISDTLGEMRRLAAKG